MKDLRMTAPREYNRATRYAFWMQVPEKRLLTVVQELSCVAGLKRSRSTGRIVVEIHDDHDPDEAWHWIRAELEAASNEVELDNIWVQAIQWLL